MRRILAAFAANSAGTGPGVILNANSDGSATFNSSDNPARIGSTITIFASGADSYMNTRHDAPRRCAT